MKLSEFLDTPDNTKPSGVHLIYALKVIWILVVTAGRAMTPDVPGGGTNDGTDEVFKKAKKLFKKLDDTAL